jgi:hypothetical protein
MCLLDDGLEFDFAFSKNIYLQRCSFKFLNIAKMEYITPISIKKFYTILKELIKFRICLQIVERYRIYLPSDAVDRHGWKQGTSHEVVSKKELPAMLFFALLPWVASLLCSALRSKKEASPGFAGLFCFPPLLRKHCQQGFKARAATLLRKPF